MSIIDKAIMRALVAYTIDMNVSEIDDVLLETVWANYSYCWTGEAFALVERAQ